MLGLGVGGIEAQASMLGQAMSMLIPKVVALKSTGGVPPGTAAANRVLTVPELVRRTGVVGKFVDFYGPGAATSELMVRPQGLQFLRLVPLQS